MSKIFDDQLLVLPEPANANIQTHIGTTGNPHGTSAADVGASPVGHDHSEVYSLTGHDHSGVYSVAAHDHSGVYATTGHDHSGVYSVVAHDHALAYEPINSNIQAHIIATGNVHGLTKSDGNKWI